MMKARKLTVFIIILLVTAFSLHAAMSSYMIPYEAINGIPMDSPYFEPVEHNWKDWKHGAATDVYNKPLVKGAYTRYMTLATCGAMDIPYNSNNLGKKIDVELTVTSPAGMNFVSLSNPHIARPFEIYIVMKHSSMRQSLESGRWQDKGYPEPKETSGHFSVVKFDKSGQKITSSFDYGALKENQVDFSFGFLDGQQMPSKGAQKVWCDVCIVLPGEPGPTPQSLADAEDRISIREGNDIKKKQLVIASDYSAALTLEMNVSIGGQVIATQIMSLPLTGFYDGSKKPNPETGGKIQLSIVPTSSCSNLDLKTQQGQYVKIADINLNTAPVTREDNTVPADNPAYIFVSSSAEPFVAGKQFVLKHIDAPDYGEYNNTTHMNYDVMLYEYDGGQTCVYDGTMALSAENAIDSYLPVAGDATENAKLNKLAKTHYIKGVTHDGVKKTFYQHLGCELGIIMEDKKDQVMARGAYKSRVYVHVVTDSTF